LKVHKNPDSPLELFDLGNDISESRDVAADHPDICRRILEIMKTSHTPSDYPAWNFA
jgi:hypothetical protein